MRFATIILIIFGGSLIAQSDCFSDCRARSNACWESLKARGITSTDSALQCDNTILQNLKGCSFPTLVLNNLNGGTFTIDELKGNVVFVHFWFTSCATCLAEMPSINQLNIDFDKKNVKFLAISFNTPEKIRSFSKKHDGFKSIQTFLDQKQLESKFCVLSGYPMNLVLDKYGNVIEAWVEENPEAKEQDGFYRKVKMLIENTLQYK
jgi:peroxiredoxin